MIDAVEDLARRWPAAAPIYRKLIRPLDVAVIGPPWSGRGTLVRALHNSLSVSAVVVDSPDSAVSADIALYLLVGRVRAGDVETISSLPRDRRIVLLNKADTCGSPDAANDAAHRCGSLLATDVLPVTGLWGAVTVTSDDATLLRELAADRVPLPRFAAQFAADDPRHAALLGRIGWRGVTDCVQEIRSGRIAGSPGDIDPLLRRRSGIGCLTTTFGQLAEPIRLFRETRAASELSALASTASGQLRDAIEHVVVDHALIGGLR
ncbi:hypothetical protein GOEFS_018_00400 [Gordonia effusa NBRC 100432]|uniref:Uncharacterized protein n=1 Tax=Gordonia effusa NBRC 100432 TaxID=1077974 RepID=H0QW06_9ACTN|nr:hypothetical protein [Gordonia effusa]GAB17007.1 hypothetical protein GOEFS_018_00400 [Gordonia effusa NBRC 100432]